MKLTDLRHCGQIGTLGQSYLVVANLVSFIGGTEAEVSNALILAVILTTEALA